MARAIGYLRVSTDEQASSGLGLDAQRSSILQAAQRMKLCQDDYAFFIDEGVSGSVPPLERPQLARAIAELRRGDVLLVAKRDRLARDVLELALLERALKKKGVRIVSAAGEGTDGDDPGSLLQRGIVDLFAQHEREMIRSRTRAALRAKRARGERAGAVPFGYSATAEGKLEPVMEELVALEFMKARREAGMGYRAIARGLTERGYATKRGGSWHPSCVKSILATDAKTRSGR